MNQATRIVVLTLAGFCIWLSFKHMDGAIAQLITRPVILSLKSGEFVRTSVLLGARDHLLSASESSRDGELFDQLSLVETVLSERGSLQERERLALLQSAESHARESLRLRAISTYVWARLALVAQKLGRPDSEVAEALSNSIRYGCATRKLVGLRLEIALRITNVFSGEDRERLSEQAEFLKKIDPGEYARLEKIGLQSLHQRRHSFVCGETL